MSYASVLQHDCMCAFVYSVASTKMTRLPHIFSRALQRSTLNSLFLWYFYLSNQTRFPDYDCAHVIPPASVVIRKQQLCLFASIITLGAVVCLKSPFPLSGNSRCTVHTVCQHGSGSLNAMGQKLCVIQKHPIFSCRTDIPQVLLTQHRSDSLKATNLSITLKKGVW